MEKKQLKKHLRLFDVYAICTGSMFSSGFFLLPGLAAAQTGPSVYLAYLVAGFLILPAMFSVAELSTAMPKAGGAYYFLDRSLGPLWGTIGGLGSWAALMFKSAFALVGMGAYLSIFLDLPYTILAVILTVMFGLVNIFGAKETSFIQRILVTALLTIMIYYIMQGLSSIIGMDLTSVPQGYSSYFISGFNGFLATIGLVFVSYAGLTKVASVAEEVDNPDRNIPLGMLLSLITTTIVYVLGVLIMVKVLDPNEFYASLTPVADAGDKFLQWLPGSSGLVLVVIAAIAAFASTGNAGILSASRYPFAMAKDRLMHPSFTMVSKFGTPAYSIIATTLIMVFILLIFNVEAVAKLASAFQLFLFGMLNLAVIVMRESRIESYEPGFKSPWYPWSQILGMLISVWLIAEMGLLSVGFTGMLGVFCAGWYYYYAHEKVEREGAVYHIHERLGRRKYEDLEYELLTILHEKEDTDTLAYDEVIAKSVVIDISGKHQTSTENIIDQASDILAGRLNLHKKLIYQDFSESFKNNLTILNKGVLLCYRQYTGVNSSEIVAFRIKGGINVVTSNLDSTTAFAILFLVTPQNSSALHLRFAGHLAEIAQGQNFLARWNKAVNEKEIREILISDERLLHLRIEEHSLLSKQIGKSINEIKLPGKSLIAIIYRSGDIIIPNGNTELEAKDELAIIGDPEDIQKLKTHRIAKV